MFQVLSGIIRNAAAEISICMKPIAHAEKEF